jgi:retron-type reverse transcriptase
MSKIIFQHTYNDIISLENLLEAWKEFVCGKQSRKDVQEFARNLITNILSLYNDLSQKTYTHSKYQAFKISDPKPRNIHKASVRDRLLHHALHRTLSPFFTKTFISDSNSCQIGRGTHRGMKRFVQFSNIVSQNNTRTAWILKCDIKKFFANIDQGILLAIIGKYISDQDILWLFSVIIRSFNSGRDGVGLPLGNLTSQLLVNIFMNEFDQWMKHKVKAEYYIRYADDFVILNDSKSYLEKLIPQISQFLEERLHLTLHPNKLYIKTFSSGVDFLGWVHFPYHKVLRTSTKKRMIRNLKIKRDKPETVESYKGMLKYGNTYKLRQKIIL